MNAKKKGRSPFSPTYEVTLSLEQELPEEERQTYVFRAATVNQRHKEQSVMEFLNDVEDADPDEVNIDTVLEKAIPLMEARLDDVTVGGKSHPELKDIKETLDVSSALELFFSAYNLEVPLIAEKKRLLSRSVLDMVGSVQPVKDAPEHSTSSKGSLNSSVQVAEGPDAESAQTLGTST